MALEPPAADELDEFSLGVLAGLFTEDQMDMALQQAADLLWMATRVEELPDGDGAETIERIVQWGMMDMAWSLLVRSDNKTEMNTPFSSERIGSYSYSKAAAAIRTGIATGVEWFDAAVNLLLEGTDYATIYAVTEQVFTSPYETSGTGPYPVEHDPAYYGWGQWVEGRGWVY